MASQNKAIDMLSLIHHLLLRVYNASTIKFAKEIYHVFKQSTFLIYSNTINYNKHDTLNRYPTCNSFDLVTKYNKGHHNKLADMLFYQPLVLLEVHKE